MNEKGEKLNGRFPMMSTGSTFQLLTRKIQFQDYKYFYQQQLLFTESLCTEMLEAGVFILTKMIKHINLISAIDQWITSKLPKSSTAASLSQEKRGELQ